MSREHAENLKEQLIASMEGRFGRQVAESVFTCDLWPVLDKAIDAGELVVWKNTIPQKPVHEAIKIWLHGCLKQVKAIRAEEPTVSKTEALRALYQLALGAEQALKNAEEVSKS